MSADYDKLKQDESDKSSKLQDLMSVSKYNSPIKNNLKNLILTKNTKTPHHRPFSHPSYYHKFNDEHFNYDDDDDYDDFINDEFELLKIRKNLLNSSQCNLDKFAYQNNSSCLAANLRNNLKTNSKSSILSSFLSAIPTLHLHLLLSLTMVLLTHRCPPQYLIVL